MGFFSKNLRFLRSSKKLSQEALAKDIGLNRGNIASYEKGSAEPNLKNLLSFAKYFNVDVGQMVEIDLEVLLQPFENVDKNAINNSQALVEESRIVDKLIDNKEQIEQFKKRSDDMVKILEGFRQFHKFKMESSGEISEDVRKMAMDYERLLDVLDEVLKSNKGLINIMEHR